MKLVLVNGTIKGEGCTVGMLPEVKKEILSVETLSSLTFPLTVQHSYEVALLRVFNYQGTWHVATARKLDAFKSFWASKISFGESLCLSLGRGTTTLESFCGTLDPGLAYFILIPLREGQRLGTILPAPENTLWLAATQNLETGAIDMDPQVAPAPCQLIPKVTVQTPEELIEYFNHSEDPHLTGFMWVDAGADQLRRFVSEEYMYRFKLRGNEPNIYKKYLELVKAQDDENADIFYEQHRAALKMFDDEMKDLVHFLHDRYVERYVHKQYQILPRAIHAVLKQCHALYLSDRTERITRDRIAGVILTFPPLFILNALAQYRQPHSEVPDYAPLPNKSRPRRPAALAPSPSRARRTEGTN